MKIIKFILFVILILSGSLQAGHAEKDKVTLQLRWKHQFQFAGYYMAKELGYYDKAGFEVEIVEGGPYTDVVKEVVSGRACYGVQTPSILIDRSEGSPVVVLAAVFQHSPVALVVNKNSGIEYSSQLIGKKIMMGLKNVEIRAMLLNEVLIDKVEVIEFTGNYNDLLEGKIDASSGYITDLTYVKDQTENTFGYIRPVTYGVDFYGDCLFTTEEIIKKNTESAVAFRSASLKGWEYAMKNPEETALLIKSKYNPELKTEHLLYEFRQMKKLIVSDLVEVGHMNPGRWKHIVEIFQRVGMINNDFDIKGFLFEDIIKDDHKTIRFVLSVLTALFFAGMIFLYIKYRKEKIKEELEEAKHKKEIESINSRFEYVLGATKTGFDIIDEEHNVVYVDPGWAHKLGDYRREKCYEYFMGIKDICPNCAISAALETGNTTISEEYLEKENRFIEVHTISLNEKLDGKSLVAEFNIDITQRKNIEKKLREFNAELEKKVDERTSQLSNTNKELESFSYSVSHDLRAPVRHIIGFTDIFMKENADILNEKSKETFSKITSSAHRMERLIDDLLMLSRTGRQELVFRKMSMEQIVKNVIEEHRDCKEHRKVETDIGEMPEVYADPNLMTIVWVNLIDNACKYTKNKDITKISISCRKENDEYVFCIKDNGVGFEPEFKHKLFGVFQRLHLEKDFSGTGIGLANVRRIITRHGGRTWAESEGEEKGAEFYFSLPIYRGNIK